MAFAIRSPAFAPGSVRIDGSPVGIARRVQRDVRPFEITHVVGIALHDARVQALVELHGSRERRGRGHRKSLEICIG